MTKQELDEEIEFIHSNRTNKELLRPLNIMSECILTVTNTYTNISLFMNDYIRLYYNGKINERVFNAAINDLYLLALILRSKLEDE